ncbi:helix-turn-helix domain-containing protein [Paenibacillus hodogayensis]|uniref:Helix-turn-helix domain-containing protein n=1 Tax=Paenibacillus hodogayensis TaxID=279208 RepID=A0ABV5W720_9BACL
MERALIDKYVPRLFYSMYWRRKDRFLLYEDLCREWTILAVEDGSFYYEFGDQKGIATFGDLVVCPAKTVLRRVVIQPLTFYVFRLRWTDLDGKEVVFHSETPLIAGKISFQNTKRLSSNFAMMREAEERNERHRMTIHNHYVQDMWYLYGKEYRNTYGLSSDEAGCSTADPVMVQAAAMLQQRAFEPFELREIASALQLSPARFTQKFKQQFSVTPNQYLVSYRLKRAKSLLMETKLTMNQIAECIGYQDGYYVSKMFRKYFNVTPSMYRSTHSV